MDDETIADAAAREAAAPKIHPASQIRNDARNAAATWWVFGKAEAVTGSTGQAPGDSRPRAGGTFPKTRAEPDASVWSRCSSRFKCPSQGVVRVQFWS